MVERMTATDGKDGNGLTPALRRAVALVALLNLAGMVGEAVMAVVAGSVSLFADAADFLEDFLINALVVTALGWSVQARRRASIWLAGLILIPALAEDRLGYSTRALPAVRHRAGRAHPQPRVRAPARPAARAGRFARHRRLARRPQ